MNIQKKYVRNIIRNVIVAILTNLCDGIIEFRRKFKKKRSYRIFVYRRLMLAMCSLVIIIFAGILLFPGAANANESTEDVLYKYFCAVEIEEGDTLWSYAEEYCPDSDYAAYIEEVRNINHMSTDMLVEGKTIVLPYYSNEYVMK